jgi:hypothetical protein
MGKAIFVYGIVFYLFFYSLFFSIHWLLTAIQF